MSASVQYLFNNHVVVLTKGAEILEVRAAEKPELFQEVINLCLGGKEDDAFDRIVDSSTIRFMSNTISKITEGMLSYDQHTEQVSFNTPDGRSLPIVDTFATCIRGAWINKDTAALDVYKRFMVKAANNPNDLSASDMFEFITVNKLPLAVDGDILAYKIVRNDFLDIHSGTKDHTPGNVVTEENADFDRNQTCSNGLHFCSKDYLPQYGGFFGCGDKTNKLVLVKIDPEHVAAFPRDYNNAKGRCVQYTVVTELPANFFTAIVSMMEQVPFVDLEQLGVSSAIADRIGLNKTAESYGLYDDVEEDEDDDLEYYPDGDDGDREDDEALDDEWAEFDKRASSENVKIEAISPIVIEVEAFDINDIADRLQRQVEAHKEAVIVKRDAQSPLVSRTVLVDPDYRWYVAVTADNQPKKYIAKETSRGAARNVRDQAVQEIAKGTVNNTYMGMVNPKVSVYDSHAL